MAVTDAYFDAEGYRAAKGLLDDSEDEIIDVQASAVSRYLDRVSGQYFNQEGAGEGGGITRRYMGKGGTLLRLDQDGCPGLASANNVTVSSGSTTYAFELFPLNAALGSEARPFTSLQLTSGAFPVGEIIEVEGVFGWPAVPDLVKETGIELLAIWRGQSPRSTGNMAEIDGAVAMSPLAMSLVKRFVSAYTKVRVA